MGYAEASATSVKTTAKSFPTIPRFLPHLLQVRLLLTPAAGTSPHQWQSRGFALLEKIGGEPLGDRKILGSSYPRSSMTAQRPNRAGFVPLYIKHSRQFCHLEQLVHMLVQVHELEPSTLIPDGSVSPNQLANS